MGAGSALHASAQRHGCPPARNLRAAAPASPRAEPRSPHSPAFGAAGAACQRLGLRAAPGCRSRSPAKRPAGAAGTRQGRCSAGVGTGRWRHRRGAGTRCAAGGIRANPALTWVWGRRAAGGGGGIPSAMPPASPAPSPGSAAAREKGDRVFGKGGELGWAGVSGQGRKVHPQGEGGSGAISVAVVTGTLEPRLPQASAEAAGAGPAVPGPVPRAPPGMLRPPRALETV